MPLMKESVSNLKEKQQHSIAWFSSFQIDFKR